MARRWFDACWPSLSDVTGDVGLVPVGAVEQHGPHLPTGTDTIIATALCEAASDRCGALVLPAIPLGASYGHGTVFPGTISLTSELLAAVVRQYADWAAVSGLTRLLFVNAHFGNTAALMIATDHLRLFRPDLRSGIVEWWTLDPVVAAEMTTDGIDLHANRGETAIMLAVAPDLVRRDEMAGADDPDRTDGLVFRYTAPSLSMNGVTGRPSEATEELGHVLFSRTADALSERVERGRVEQPPLCTAPIPDFAPAPLRAS